MEKIRLLQDHLSFCNGILLTFLKISMALPKLGRELLWIAGYLQENHYQ